MAIRRWVLAAVAAGLVGGIPGLARADSVGEPATFASQGLTIQRLTAAAQMTKDDPVPFRAFTGPSHMLADPSDPRIILATTAELRNSVCYLIRSTDTGRTWHILSAQPALGTYPYCTSSTAGVPLQNLAWGRNNTLYYALDGYSTADGGNSRAANASVLLARSTDLGDSWSTTLVDNNRGKTGANITHDGPVTGLAVDTSGPRDVVYLGFSQSYPDAAKGSARTGDNTMVTVSSDGGLTFGTPVNINRFSHVSFKIAGQSYPLVMSSFGRPYLAVHNGVVVAVGLSDPALNVKLPKVGPMQATPGTPMLAARSTDRGATWSFTTLSAPVITATGGQVGMGWTPKGGANGTFLAAYAATPDEQMNTAAVIYLQRSTDSGRTWTRPVIIDDDSASQQFTHFFPQMGVAPNGRVDVTWYDNRRSHGYAFDIYYTYSANGGATWAHNVRITDRPSYFGLGVSFNSDVRQPPGVASANQYAAFGWTDTRLGTVQTQTQDDFGDVAQFAPLPPATSNLLPILASVFGGLIVAGLASLVVVRAQRRRSGPTPPPKVSVQEPVGTG